MKVLISVSDKSGIVPFAQQLHRLGADIVSTGGTANLLKKEGIEVQNVAELTGFPEVMGGRVKTLHPYIYAGILARQGVAEDAEVLQQLDLTAFDLVVVNLYPFRQTMENPASSQQDIIENIDIGGPCMIRAAAKNHARVMVVVEPADYQWLSECLSEKGELTYSQRFKLASKAFQHCADYDADIATWFVHQEQEDCSQDASKEKVNDDVLPEILTVQSQSRHPLRYGENPHQQAAFYHLPQAPSDSIANIQQHQGKPLSYNNIMDGDVALELVKQFSKPACVIVKHACPCGVAQSDDLLTSYQLAYDCDSESAFGGIIGVNQIVTEEIAQHIISNQFFEIIIAPEYTTKALTAFSQKENVRVLQYHPNMQRKVYTDEHNWDMRQVNGGVLYQQKLYSPHRDFAVMSKQQPDEQSWQELYFAWDIVGSIKSNAIVYTKKGQTLGIGGGQTSRVMSVEIAAIKAQKAGLSLVDSVLASDAFFPFKDSIEFAASQGVKAIIQPGGSMRDEEVIDMANKHGMVMVFTHYRCFKH